MIKSRFRIGQIKET